MKAISLEAPNEWIIKELPMPVPTKGQVLVKMAFAPINPSDLAFLTGEYGLKKPYPVVPGLEGSGVVVATGGGFMAKRLLGKKVACTAPNSGNGTWAEYMLTDFDKCIDLNNDVDLQQASMFFVNPLTALAFVKMARKSDLIVMDAAGSALAKMVDYFAKKAKIPLWAVLRNKAKLNYEGFEKVFESSNDNFYSELASATQNFKNVIFFDAVSGGEMPYKLLNSLPENAKMVIYGRLDLNAAGLQPQNILFKQNKIEGFWLAKEAQKKSLIQILMDVNKIKKMLKDDFKTNIQAIISLDELNQGIKLYAEKMSEGKVLIGF